MSSVKPEHFDFVAPPTSLAMSMLGARERNANATLDSLAMRQCVRLLVPVAKRTPVTPMHLVRMCHSVRTRVPATTASLAMATSVPK